MNHLVSIFFGLDKIVLDRLKPDKLMLFGFIIINALILSISAYSIYNAMMQISDSFIIAVLISTFITLLLLNTYRLIYSIISDYEFNYTRIELIKDICSKGFLLIVLTIFISSCFTTILYSKKINQFLEIEKQKLVDEYTNSLSSIYDTQIDEKLNAFNSFKELNIQLGEKNNPIDSIDVYKQIESIELTKQTKLSAMTFSISKSNFFVTKLKIASTKIPEYWLLLIIQIIISIFPIYFFKTNTFFIDYLKEEDKINNKLILEEYNLFKRKYIEQFSLSINENLNFEEKYIDPPFNTKPIVSSTKRLTKGSLLKWFENYE